MNVRNRCAVYVFLVLAFMGWLSPPIFVGKIECTVSSRIREVSTPFQLGRQSIFQLHFANACGLQ